LRLVAEQKSRVPNEGATWHWISYYSTEKFVSLQDNIKIVPNVVFNYLGEVKPDARTQPEMFRMIQKPDDKAASHLYDVTGRSPHTCTTIVEEGQLKITWEYFSALDEQATIEQLVREYLAILRSFIRSGD
jgi:non-ribosomal peptide synthase protein (TIGR01720 family)